MDLGALNVEAIFSAPGDKTHLHVISDDGGNKIGKKDCKEVDPKAQRFVPRRRYADFCNKISQSGRRVARCEGTRSGGVIKPGIYLDLAANLTSFF
jgi:hypothetical protein